MTTNNKGVSIVAAIFIIVILAFMGVMLVSILGGGTSASVNEMQSARALYIAEGGLEYALQAGTFCNYNVAATTLGIGSFTVASQYIGPGAPPAIPPTTLSGALVAGANTINVANTANYVIPGAIQIDAEYIHCTGMSGGSQFTGCTRGWATTTNTGHSGGTPVIQCSVTSAGSVPTGFLVGTVSRTVQASVGP